ncbi:MAG: MFS transporter [Actinomycetes bacterium]
MPRLGPVTTSVSTTVLAVLPVYLVGGLAGPLRDDMPLSATALGVAVGAFFAMSAVASPVFGRYTEQRDPWTVIRGSVLVAVVALLGIAALTQSWVHLAGWLMVAGVANSLVQPVTNSVVAHHVDRARHGIVLGAKQAAIPAASLLAGLGVTLLAHPLGWRSLFALAGGIGVLMFFLLPTAGGVRRPSAGTRDAPRRLTGLMRTAVAAAFGASAANSVPVFITGTAIAEGVEGSTAGLLLSLGSAAAIAARLVMGRVADTARVDRFRLLSLVMVLGAVGLGVLALIPSLGSSLSTAGLVVGTVLAFGAGWGWQGLLHLAVVTRYPSAPSRATGVVISGVYVGGIAGPILLGVLIDHVGYTGAWAAGAVNLLVAATVTWPGRTSRLPSAAD